VAEVMIGERQQQPGSARWAGCGGVPGTCL